MTGLLTVDEVRMRHLDFTVPLFLEQIHIGVRRPVLEPDMAGFVKPLTIFVRFACFFDTSVSGDYLSL
ncbi:hypothetical protein E2C01_057388 [Portunus trituberculatus]|uniref:Uncharacterized protein n=1 Tax=Portunus trituberculatus TaxID=210409 RepID=A0A5B7GWN2_PORTR|nr:hypothetical protein [Portunus trituberculatus]